MGLAPRRTETGCMHDGAKDGLEEQNLWDTADR